MNKNYKQWTKEEIEKLKRLYKEPLSSFEISKILSRNYCSVSRKASKLKLIKPFELKSKIFSKAGKGINHKEKNAMWKGDDVTYAPLHKWINRNKIKLEHCENCGRKVKLELSNISGEYKRDINDFEWLCRKCHMNKDGRINNLLQFKIKEERLCHPVATFVVN